MSPIFVTMLVQYCQTSNVKAVRVEVKSEAAISVLVGEPWRHKVGHITRKRTIAFEIGVHSCNKRCSEFCQLEDGGLRLLINYESLTVLVYFRHVWTSSERGRLRVDECPIDETELVEDEVTPSLLRCCRTEVASPRQINRHIVLEATCRLGCRLTRRKGHLKKTQKEHMDMALLTN